MRWKLFYSSIKLSVLHNHVVFEILLFQIHLYTNVLGNNICLCKDVNVARSKSLKPLNLKGDNTQCSSKLIINFFHLFYGNDTDILIYRKIKVWLIWVIPSKMLWQNGWLAFWKDNGDGVFKCLWIKALLCNLQFYLYSHSLL